MGETKGHDQWVAGPRDADGNLDTTRALIMEKGGDGATEQLPPAVEASTEMLADLEGATLTGIDDIETQEDVQDHFSGIKDQMKTLLSEEPRSSYDLSQYGDLLANLGGRMGLVKMNERMGYEGDPPDLAADAMRKHGNIKQMFEQVGARLFPDVKSPEGLDDAPAGLDQIRSNLSKQEIFAHVGVSVPSAEELATMSPKQIANQIDFLIESLGGTMEHAANIDEEAVQDGKIGVDQPVQVAEAAKALFHLSKVRDVYFKEAYSRGDLTSADAKKIDAIKSDLGIEAENKAPIGRWDTPQVTAFNELVSSVARGDLNDEISRLKKYENLDDPDDEMAAGDARNALQMVRKYATILSTSQRAKERGESVTPDQLAVMMRPLEHMAKGQIDDLPAAIEKVNDPDLKKLLEALEASVRSLGGTSQ